MSQLQIKTESFPTRCEVCHQADFFDPKRNHCSRCAGVAVRQMTETAGFKPTVLSFSSEAGEFARGILVSFISLAFTFLLAGSVLGFIDAGFKSSKNVIFDAFLYLAFIGYWLLPVGFSVLIGMTRPRKTVSSYWFGMFIGFFPLLLLVIIFFAVLISGFGIC